MANHDPNPSTRSRMNAGRSHGFTLIELLVVISIISLLVAILLPALSSARETARRIACASNMRQAGIIYAIYNEDEDGLYPPGRYDIAFGIRGTTGPTLRNSYGMSLDLTLCPGGADYPTTSFDWSVDWGSPNSFAKMQYHYIMGDGGRAEAAGVVNGWFLTYMSGWQIKAGGADLYPKENRDEVGQASIHPVMLDLAYPHYDASIYTHKPQRSNHVAEGLAADGQNVLFADGHVVWQQLERGKAWRLGRDYYEHIFWNPKSVKNETAFGPLPVLP